MDLTTLSKEDLIEVSTALIQGKTLEEVERIFISINMRGLVESMHTLLCRQKHHESEDCTFYEEIGYNALVKKKWLESTLLLMKKFDIDEQTLGKAMSYAYKIEGLLRALLSKEEEKVGDTTKYLLLLLFSSTPQEYSPEN